MAIRSVPISVTAVGIFELIPAPVAGKRIVFRYTVVMEGSHTIKFQSGANDLTGAMALADGQSISASAWLFCNKAEALNIDLAVAGAPAGAAGHVEYQIDDQDVGP